MGQICPSRVSVFSGYRRTPRACRASVWGSPAAGASAPTPTVTGHMGLHNTAGSCARRFFLDNVAGWILELDRGQGIPFEGNYSQWLEARARRMAGERKQQAGLQRAIDDELEFVRSKAKGQQKKGKARMRRYDELVSKVLAAHADSCPQTFPGPLEGAWKEVPMVNEGEHLTRGWESSCQSCGRQQSSLPMAVLANMESGLCREAVPCLVAGV